MHASSRARSHSSALSARSQYWFALGTAVCTSVDMTHASLALLHECAPLLINALHGIAARVVAVGEMSLFRMRWYVRGSGAESIDGSDGSGAADDDGADDGGVPWAV